MSRNSKWAYRMAEGQKLAPSWTCPSCGAVIYTALGIPRFCPVCKVPTKNPIRHTKEGWFWGSVGPQPTRAALLRQVRAIYASGYRDNPTRREAAIAKYRRLESELERTTSKRRTKTLIDELSRLEYKYRMTREEVHGKWKSGSPELDAWIEYSQRLRKDENPTRNPGIMIGGNPMAKKKSRRPRQMKVLGIPVVTLALVGGLAWLLTRKS